MNKSVLILLGIVIKMNALWAQDAQTVFDEYKRDIQNNWSSHKAIGEKEWNNYKIIIKNKWKDELMPSKKTYVEYYNNFNSRMIIDFESGNATLETISSNKSLSENEINASEQALIEKKDLLEWPVRLSDGSTFGEFVNKKIEGFNSKLFQGKGVPFENKNGTSYFLYKTQLTMAPDHIKKKAIKLIPTIKLLAKDCGLPVEFILSIIWQESAFNPLARSHIPAFGLMQIVPKYAGNEVRDYLQENQIIDENFLYIPENNIKYGISYLKILSEKYFQDINPIEKRIPFIIAGYNWGPNRLLKHINNGKISLSTNPKDIKEQIVALAPNETKDYLVKVIERWKIIEKEKWL